MKDFNDHLPLRFGAKIVAQAEPASPPASPPDGTVAWVNPDLEARDSDYKHPCSPVSVQRAALDAQAEPLYEDGPLPPGSVGKMREAATITERELAFALNYHGDDARINDADWKIAKRYFEVVLSNRGVHPSLGGPLLGEPADLRKVLKHEHRVYGEHKVYGHPFGVRDATPEEVAAHDLRFGEHRNRRMAESVHATMLQRMAEHVYATSLPPPIVIDPKQLQAGFETKPGKLWVGVDPAKGEDYSAVAFRYGAQVDVRVDRPFEIGDHVETHLGNGFIHGIQPAFYRVAMDNPPGATTHFIDFAKALPRDGTRSKDNPLARFMRHARPGLPTFRPERNVTHGEFACMIQGAPCHARTPQQLKFNGPSGRIAGSALAWAPARSDDVVVRTSRGDLVCLWPMESYTEGGITIENANPPF
jgi:hypothetical protein